MVRTRALHRLKAPALLLVAGLVVSCASTPSLPRVVAFPHAGAARVHATGLIASYEDALNAVMRVMENELGFPPVAGALELYPDRASLEAGLRAEGYETSYAHQVASKLDGIARPGRVMANDSVLRWQHWPARIAFLAHETTHVAEFALANGRRGSSDQWLREGLAEWVAWRVVQALQLGSFPARRRLALVHLREAGDRHDLPAFSELVSQSAWVRRGKDSAADPGYDQAFLATDLLIERHGLPAVLEYFRLFEHSDDSLANFRAAFGEERSLFETGFQAHLERLLK